MNTIFIVIASVVVAFVLLIVGLVVLLMVLKWRLKRAVQDLGDSLKDLGMSLKDFGANIPPTRLHLKPAADPAWSEKEKVLTAIGELHALGFQDVGSFSADELPKLHLHALIHPEHQLYGVVYDQPPIGIWTDLVTAYDDHSTFTVVNNARGEGLDRPPGHPILRIEGAYADEMFRRMVAERPGKPPRAITADEFVPIFERSYADYMDWRHNRGFASEEEIRTQAEKSGHEVNPAAVALTKGLLEAQTQFRLYADLHAACQRQLGLTGDEWEDLSARLVYVHDRSTIAETQSQLAEATGGEVTNLPDVSDPDPRSYFRQVNDRLAADKQFRHVATLTEPVGADVYESPAEVDSACSAEDDASDGAERD